MLIRFDARPLRALFIIPAALALAACTFPEVIGKNMASDSGTGTTEPGGTSTDGESVGTTSGPDVLTGEPATTTTTGAPDATTTSGPDTTTTSGPDTTTTGEPGVCLEWEATDPEQEYPAELTCGLPEQCPGSGPLVFAVEGDPDDPSAVQTDDIDRARCMAAALRDRSPGQVSFGRQLALGFDLHMLEILGPQVVDRLDYTEDFNFEKYARVHPMRPADAFTACAEGTAIQIWTCLTHAHEDACVTGELACPP